MRRFTFLSCLSFVLVTATLASAKSESHMSGPHDVFDLDEEIVDVGNVFIPKGFDANDHVEVMASGFLPSPCYRRPYGLVEKVGNEIKIGIRASRVVDRSHICIDMAVPFLVSIPVGPVPAGEYKVEVNTETNAPAVALMKIEPATNNSIDNFLYANVEQVSVDKNTRTVTLRGQNPSPCVVLDRIISTSNGVNTYAVLPIMKKKDALCPQVLTPFEYAYQLPGDLHAQKVLVHVRSLDGNAKNAVFSGDQ